MVPDAYADAPMTATSSTATEGKVTVTDDATTAGRAVLGVDPGARWTAGVLRYGDVPLYGWTIGPTDADGTRNRNALDDADDVRAVARYVGRIADQIDRTLDLAERDHGLTQVRLAIETTVVPVGYAARERREGSWRTKMQLVDWLVPREVVIGLVCVYPDARLIQPRGHGRGGPMEDYPAELRRKRPPGWGPNDALRGERDHERAAYDVAGIAARLPWPTPARTADA